MLHQSFWSSRGVVLPGGWRWGHAALCPSGVPAACWFSGSAAGCWWPWWTPSALGSRRSSWPRAARSPRTPRSEGTTTTSSADPQVGKHRHYRAAKSCKHQAMRSTKANISYSHYNIMVKTIIAASLNQLVGCRTLPGGTEKVVPSNI